MYSSLINLQSPQKVITPLKIIRSCDVHLLNCQAVPTKLSDGRGIALPCSPLVTPMVGVCLCVCVCVCVRACVRVCVWVLIFLHVASYKYICY